MSLLRRIRDGLGRIPSAGRWCALIAVANVLAWSFITPPFHVPDETAHVAYVQHLAEHAEPPNEPGGNVFSSQQAALLDALLFPATVGRPENGTIWYELQQDGVDATEDRSLEEDDAGGIVSNSNQPPLYYALEAGAYLASPSGDLLDRLALMRLISALLAGLTTLMVFMFLREVLAERWTWTVGALAVAFQPTFGFISGGVSADALLFTASAALFLALARAFRRGLTVERALYIGAALAVGVLTKLNFIALVPGALLGVGLLAWQVRPRRLALSASAAAAGLLAAASCAYVALNLLAWDRSAWGGGVETAAINATGGPSGVAPIGLTEQLGYTWQLYAPRLPFMNDQFDYFPLYATWFKGSIGLFGWLDTRFPEWVYTLALCIVIPLIVLALVALVQRRSALREHWPELLTYAVMVAGLLGSIGFLGLRYRKDSGFIFEQARYLLPLLPLYGAGLALAALGAGKRFARPLGATIVVLALGHSLFAQLLVIGRFYA
jgi:4-amino-4-deoxy-L-arabinose transferase-like glycosyltransferase